MLGPFEHVCDFVESLSNGSRIKFELDQTFARLPYDFSFVLKKVGSCRNRLDNSSNFGSTFTRHSFDADLMNVGQKSKPFTKLFGGNVVFQVLLR